MREEFISTGLSGSSSKILQSAYVRKIYSQKYAILLICYNESDP